jgi:hypothetical protein
MTLGKETFPVSVDSSAFAGSVHGQAGLSCTDCHTDITEYPHPEVAASGRRDLTLKLYTSCKECHEDKYKLTLDSVHQRALAAGNRGAAVCTDCHDPHAQAKITGEDGRLLPSAQVQIPATCARCHQAVYDAYKRSVHGAALIGGGNRDVPSCVDCHGVHSIPDPLTARFRLQSPQMCADCHTDKEKMARYGISTAVLRTYIADFHGTTVTLFEKQTPDQQTNKPVCYDCHGVHDIRRPEDPDKGLHVKQNLLEACKKCHPDATPNFPSSWLSHYIPSRERNPLVFFVNAFYNVVIPSTIGGMLVFVVADFRRRLIDRRRKRGGAA